MSSNCMYLHSWSPSQAIVVKGCLILFLYLRNKPSMNDYTLITIEI